MSVTREAALDALSHLETWAKWMAGIETAVVGGIVALLFKHDGAVPSLSLHEKRLAFGVFVSMGLALFCSAWVLSSLPSQALRLDPQAGVPSVQNDIYENTLYGWMANKKVGWLRLGLVMSLQHWLWVIGLTLAGLLFLRRL